jgi:hypothetical protein
MTDHEQLTTEEQRRARQIEGARRGGLALHAKLRANPDAYRKRQAALGRSGASITNQKLKDDPEFRRSVLAAQIAALEAKLREAAE